MRGKLLASATSQKQTNGHLWSELSNVIWKFIGHGGAKQYPRRLGKNWNYLQLYYHWQQDAQQETKDNCR